VLWRVRRRLVLVARAEHELRGPLTALSLAVHSLARDPSGRDAVAPLEAQLDRLRTALADLDAARRGRRAPAQARALSLERLVRSHGRAWSAVARADGRRVELDWRAGEVTVTADRGRLSQVLGNLISNAIEHGGGDVRLVGRRIASGVRIEVSDSGRGFGASRGPGEGRGNGLPIAARAVEEAGGRLRMSSSDRGATVAVELPLAER
jgi:signal transduction histidine kinase